MTELSAPPRAREEGQPASLRVLLVTNMYPTEDEPWFGCFIRDQAEDLNALGLDVRVLSFDGRRDRLNYLRAARKVRELVGRERFDVVHAHYGLTGAVATLQRKAPLVTTFHGSDYNGWSPWQRYVSWFVARRSTPIVMSDEGRSALGRPSAAVIPCGVDTELFTPLDRRAARRKLEWQEDGHYVLFPGSRANRRKRADLFDATVAEARKEVPLLRDVALEGLSREHVALAMAAADVTVMTSDAEGSPVAVRESLSCMTPVVSVEVGDVLEVVANLRGCSIHPRDPRALARGVLDAIAAGKHSELRERAERFSRRVVAERVAAVYASLVKTRLTQPTGMRRAS